MSRTTARQAGTVALLIAVVLLGGFLRTSFFRNFANPQGGFFFYGVDAYDHLRRVTLGIQSFPRVPVRDSYMGFPAGTGQIWSPLYDYVLSAVSILAGGSRSAIETICFFANPAYAAVSILLLFFVARGLFGGAAPGLAAAFLLAASPAHISYSHPMNFDHHVLEPLAVMILMALVFVEVDDRLSRRGRIAVAGALLSTIFLWRGSTVYWGLTFLRVLLWSVACGRPALSRDYAWSFAGAAVALGLFVLLDPWDNARAVSFEIVSSFHVMVLGAAALVLGGAGVAADGRRLSLPLGGAVLAAAAAVMLPPMREAAQSLVAGAAFFGRTADPWLASNSELKGMFQDRDFFAVATYLTLPWFFAPAAVAHASYRWWRFDRDNRLLFGFCFVAPLLAMGLVRRYGHIAGTGAALAGGYLFGLAWTRWSRPAAKLGAGVFLVALLLPSLPHYRDTWESRLPEPMRLGLLGPRGALPWLRDHTPRTSYYLRPTEVPEYGVMAEWDMGALVYQVAERPAVATAFGWETHGLYEENAFMAAAEPEVGARILGENRVRYVLLRALQDRSRHFAIAQYGAEQGRLPRDLVGFYRPEEAMYTRLMYNDGAAHRIGAAIVPGLGQYRLVFESEYLFSKEPGRELSYYKVFEFVRGARIEGTAAPGSDVLLQLPLRTSRGRLLRYTNWTRAMPDGRFTFTVPYATDAAHGGTLANGAYSVSDARGRVGTVDVAEPDVVAGHSVDVVLAAPGAGTPDAALRSPR